MKKPSALRSAALAAAAAALLLPGLAAAQLTANVGLTTNYKYRGQDQGNNQPALFGGFDYTAGGFYVGNWNSSVGFTDAGLEMDFYGGYRGEIGGISYDVGLLYYYYPQKDEVASLDTTEAYIAATFGPVTAKYSHTISSKYFGLEEGSGTGYIDLTANFELAKGIVLNAHYGLTRFTSGTKNIYGIPNYADYKLGATFDIGNGFSLAGAYVGANKKDFFGDINKGRIVLTLTKAM
jgi:uncharacterized protein (TIGR02001 family)